MDRFDEGIYRIGAVVKMLGVPAQTLRSWEMRYQRIQAKRIVIESLGDLRAACARTPTRSCRAAPTGASAS